MYMYHDALISPARQSLIYSSCRNCRIGRSCRIGKLCVVASALYFQDLLSLQLYSINANHLSSETVTSPIRDLLISQGHLVLGTANGTLIVKELFG